MDFGFLPSPDFAALCCVHVRHRDGHCIDLHVVQSLPAMGGVGSVVTSDGRGELRFFDCVHSFFASQFDAPARIVGFGGGGAGDVVAFDDQLMGFRSCALPDHVCSGADFDGLAHLGFLAVASCAAVQGRCVSAVHPVHTGTDGMCCATGCGVSKPQWSFGWHQCLG